MSLLTRFNLRNDLVNRKKHNSFIGTVYATKTHATNNAISRNYVNSILYHVNKLYSTPNNGSSLTKSELEEIITKTINAKIIDVSKLEEISKSINQAKTSIDESVNLLKDHEQFLYETIEESIIILKDLNETIKTSSLNMEIRTQNTLDKALQSIDEEKQKALDAIASNNVDNIKEELLEKIDYIFQMFYHEDSHNIIEKYPLNK